jgi:glucose-6-phosphate isomerase
MKESVILDYNYLMSVILKKEGAISDEDIGSIDERAQAVVRRLDAERAAGGLAFADTDELSRHLPAIGETAARIKERFPTLVVLGIGGSALGARAVKEALVNPFAPTGTNVIIADNIDPAYTAGLIDSLDLEKTAFNVVSKSGGTVETLAQFMIVAGLLKKRLGDAGFREHIVITTDPKKGVLREIAGEERIASLEVPPGIGGRFSVLTPVGLFPAACMGVDADKLLDGAAGFIRATRDRPWDENPAYLYGALLFIAAVKKKRNISVMMPYSGRLFSFALWYSQLWAESLGKPGEVNGKRRGVGQTPVAAVGVTDQHSQLQLFMEGPEDKVITFIEVKDHGPDVVIPNLWGDRESMGYLGGKRIGELFDAERSATESALAVSGRMSMTVTIPDISPESLGTLFAFFQEATAFAGYLYEVDPFGQPGVEEGKKYTWGIMGRTGYEGKLREYRNRPQKQPSYTRGA